MRSKYFIAVTTITLLGLVFSSTLHSQVLISLLFGEKLNSESLKFGLDGGVNFSGLTQTDGSKFRHDFNLGLYFDFRLKPNKNWFLHTGALLKSDMGARNVDVYPLDDPGLDSMFAGGYVKRQLKYINIPVLVRYRLKHHLFFEIGPMIGIMTRATDVFYNTVIKDEDLSYKNKVTDRYKWFDAGVEAGIGYQLIKGTGVSFGVRYYQGLLNVRKDGPGQVWNQSFYLFVSIPVGAGEKAHAKKAQKEHQKG